MSALDEIILSKKYGQSYTPLESVLMVHKKRYPNDAATAAAELLALRERVAKLERIETIAAEVNEWLKNNGLMGTAHQRELEAALKSQ